MAFYRVMHTFVDNENGIHPKVGNFVDTENKEWVARIGSTLKEETFCPNNVDVIKVGFTVESAAKETPVEEPKVVEPEVPPAPPAPPVKDTARLNIPNKAVLEPGEQK